MMWATSITLAWLAWGTIKPPYKNNVAEILMGAWLLACAYAIWDRIP
ncbi:hypothetical protein [Muricoccus nepalensis]|nr:hypothetical protein [Roseomonas nepalensis]